MDNLWLVLIDTSGSMDDGFGSGKSPTRGRVRTGGWDTKIEAAKELLESTIANLRTPDVAVVEFNSSSRLLFHAHSNDSSHYNSRIKQLQAGGTTELAHALDHLSDLISKNGYKELGEYREIQILVITDGLTKSDSSGQASKRLISSLINTRTNIRVLLIDRTPEGDETAYKVATNDDVEYAENYEATQNATSASAASSLSYNLATTGVHQRALYKEQAVLRGRPPVKTIGFVNSGPDRLNSISLSNEVVPTLSALEEIQAVSESDGVKRDVEIYSLTKSSDLKVSVSGMAKAIEVIEELFTPWKREHSRNIRRLELEEKELQIRKLRAETEQIEQALYETKVAREKEARRQEIENINKEIEMEERRLRLERERYAEQLVWLARRITESLCSNYDLSEDDLANRHMKVKESLEILARIKYSIETIHEDDIVYT